MSDRQDVPGSAEPPIEEPSSTHRGSARWRWRAVALLLTLGAGVLMMSSIDGGDRGQQTVEIEPPQPPRVGVATVERRDLVRTREAAGHLQASRMVELSVGADGRVLSLSVEEGAWVEAGHLLVELDDRRHRAELAEAEADLLTVQARHAVFIGLDQVAREMRPAPLEDRTGLPSGAAGAADESSAPTAEQRRNLRQQKSTELLNGLHQDDVRAAITGLMQAEQRLDRARLELEATRLRAPFAGRVADLAVAPGQLLSSAEVAMVLLDTRKMQVDVEVLEDDIVRLRQGDSATVRVPALADLRVEGTVQTVNPRVDPETGTGRVTVEIERPPRGLLHGLRAWVELEVERLPDRVVVAQAAVLDRQGRSVVFRVEDGRAHWVEVELGVSEGGWVEVHQGLEVGDRVAVSGHLSLGHEVSVRPFAATSLDDGATGSGGGDP